MTSESKWRNLGLRTASALAAASVLLVVYLTLEWAGIIGLGLVLEVFVVREGLRLIQLDPLDAKLRGVFGAIIYLLFLAILFFQPHRFAIWMGFSTLFLAGSLTLPTEKDLHQLHNIQSRSLLMSLYLAVFPALLLDLLFKYHGALWFISLLLMVFAGDIGAYLCGVAFGKRNILPHISPKKTWEGSMGGFFATLAAASIIYIYAELKMPMAAWLLMAGLISFVAQAGDYFESLLKRLHNVKDSGTLMPGHGGILDRIDGLLFAAPIMSVALTFFDPWL